MIQRIQSVLLLVAFLAGVIVFFFPLACIYGPTTAYKFYIYGMVNMVPDEPSVISFMTTFPLLLLNILAAALAFSAIFFYKNRITQMKIVRFAIFLEIILIALIFFIYANIIEKNLMASPEYMEEAGIYFPLIAMIFLILANRRIMRDEKLVRSVDRLR